MLTSEQKDRYSRHIKLPGFGIDAQERLLAARVLIIGAGGLGCPIGLYLAASGVGTIGIVDDDVIDISNLQRQVAFKTSDIGTAKAEKLASSMKELNPELVIEIFLTRITAENVEKQLAEWDLVIDGTDNFATRFLISDACYFARRPLLTGAVYRYGAQILLTVPGKTPCPRCVFQKPPESNVLESCSEVGVLGPVVGTTGTMMATEVIKYLCGLKPAVLGTLLLYDAVKQDIRRVVMERDRSCPLCGDKPSIKKIQQTEESLCSTEAKISMSVDEAEKFIESHKAILLDVREANEYETGHLPGALSFPLSQIDSHREELKQIENPIVVYCQKGKRSLRFVETLRQMGLNDSFSVIGGIEAWTASIHR